MNKFYKKFIGRANARTSTIEVRSLARVLSTLILFSQLCWRGRLNANTPKGVNTSKDFAINVV